MPTTMDSTKMSNFSVRAQRRRRPIDRPRTLRGAAVAMVVPMAILSCHDFPAYPAFLVTGLSVPAARSTRHSSTMVDSKGNYRHQSLMKSRNVCPSHLSDRRRKRESMCLLGAQPVPDSETSSTAVLPDAASKTETKPLSPMEDVDEKGLLMNPMEDFGTTETMGFDGEYKRGLLTIGFITFLFATNSPVLHWAFTSGENPPPVLLVNAAVSVVALVGLLLGGDTLEGTSALPTDDSKESKTSGWVGGLELGIWKFLGTTSNLYGLALTTASHGALLIQLTTLIVPTTRALVYKESISTKLKLSIGLALSGVLCFANDPTGTPSLLGDALCVVAAICYSAYDLRLYEYGKVVDAVKPLITTKIATQALFSIGLLFLAPASLLSEGSTAGEASWQESFDYLQALATSSEWLPVVTAIVWSGVAVNAVAPFLQVGGQQIVGPTKCQTIYASQPLWAAALSFCFLGERLGLSGIVGGSAFLVALALAATAESAKEIVAIDTETKIPSSAAVRIEESTIIEMIDTTRSNATAAPIDIGAGNTLYQ